MNSLCRSEPADPAATHQLRRHLGYPSSSKNVFYEWRESQRFALGRRLMRVIPTQLTSAVDADVLWSRGITGKGVK